MELMANVTDVSKEKKNNLDNILYIRQRLTVYYRSIFNKYN